MSFVVIVVVGVVGFIALRQFVIPAVSPMPTNLGVNNGQLAPCPDKPNCVSTQAAQSDKEHHVQEIPFAGSVEDAHAAVLEIVQGLERVEIITNEPTYIHATTRSAAWGFIDDLEIFIDEDAGVIHMRNAARLGMDDLNKNRERVLAISAQLREKLPQSVAAME